MLQNRGEPETVLLLTRTRTDARGRRHSVAVPLLPPPDGEKFAGGYQIQVRVTRSWRPNFSCE